MASNLISAGSSSLTDGRLGVDYPTALMGDFSMGPGLAALAGVFIALAGSFPLTWVLELGLRGDERATITRGVAGILVSFIVSSALLLVAFFLFAGEFRTCGIAYVVALVVVWSVETVRAYVLM